MDVALLFTTALVLALAPSVVDRWAARRGASPGSLAVLALVTLAGLAALPPAFAICTATLVEHDEGAFGLRLAAVAGLLLVAVVAGRAVATVFRIRRRWSDLSRVAAALGTRRSAEGVNVLPVGDVLAFVAGTDAFVSQGLADRLSPVQQRAVVEHEREHATARHGRLVTAARAVTHGLFGVRPARRAEVALHRELDGLADRAAARQLDDTAPVREALVALAPEGAGGERSGASVSERLARLDAERRNGIWSAESAVRALTVVVGAMIFASICVSVHATGVWLGLVTCAAALAGFVSLVRPVVRRAKT